jgi:hypothetical protein
MMCSIGTSNAGYADVTIVGLQHEHEARPWAVKDKRGTKYPAAVSDQSQPMSAKAAEVPLTDKGVSARESAALGAEGCRPGCGWNVEVAQPPTS